MPSSTTILVSVLPYCSLAHVPAVTPSFLKSRPTQLANVLSGAVTVRSSRITGILAAWASFRTSSHPSSTIGAMTIASTFWLMNERTAAIWAAGDFVTGIITWAPGTYHCTGVSVVAYRSGGGPAEMTTVRAPASAGYCRLRTVGPSRVLNPGMRDVDNADPSVICIGSPSTANLTASVFEAYLETDKTVEMVLEHQSGSNPEQIYLRVYTQNSPWHAMARISIRTM